METRPYSLAVGLFVIILLISGLLFVLWFSRFEMGDDKRSYMIHFKGSVSGLRINETVRFHGIPIGSVKRIFVDPETISAVKVKVSIDKPELIREDSLASIEAQGLTGFSFIQIIGGSPSSPLLKAKPGQRHPVIASRPSNIEMLFTSVPQILNNIQDLSQKLNHLFNEKNVEFLGQTFESFSKITGQFSQEKWNVQSLIKKTEKNLDHLTHVITQAESTLTSFKEASEVFKDFIKESEKPFHHFARQGLPEMTSLAKELRQTTYKVHLMLDQIERSPLRFLRKDSSKGVPVS
jgi:phospholipid/cholesterol/gamma-HCH transport system substrate-binding protein